VLIGLGVQIGATIWFQTLYVFFVVRHVNPSRGSNAMSDRGLDGPTDSRKLRLGSMAATISNPRSRQMLCRCIRAPLAASWHRAGANAFQKRGAAPGISSKLSPTRLPISFRMLKARPRERVNLAVRIEFNPNITTAWFTSVMAIINNVTMLAIILAGAALIREREHGTMDHLLVMPLTPFEIAMAKVWANGLVITIAVGLSLYGVVRMLLGVPIAGSTPLFMVGVMIYLFFATAIGIFLGTVARSMPQLGLLFLLVFVPMNQLSGSNTPLESMPAWLATAMQASPSTHFVSFAQAILYRGAGTDVVWPEFVIVALIGSLFFALAILRFRSVAAQASLQM